MRTDEIARRDTANFITQTQIRLAQIQQLLGRDGQPTSAEVREMHDLAMAIEGEAKQIAMETNQWLSARRLCEAAPRHVRACPITKDEIDSNNPLIHGVAV